MFVPSRMIHKLLDTFIVTPCGFYRSPCCCLRCCSTGKRLTYEFRKLAPFVWLEISSGHCFTIYLKLLDNRTSTVKDVKIFKYHVYLKHYYVQVTCHFFIIIIMFLKDFMCIYFVYDNYDKFDHLFSQNIQTGKCLFVPLYCCLPCLSVDWSGFTTSMTKLGSNNQNCYIWMFHSFIFSQKKKKKKKKKKT